MDDKTIVVLFDRLFANTIAFLLPGLAVLVGAATVNPVIVRWFGGASNSPTLVGFLFVIFAALAIGVVVSAMRWWIFESVTRWPGCGGKSFAPRGTPVDESNRAKYRAEYEDLRLHHYYHYLANANMAVAIIVALGLWLFAAPTHPSTARVIGVAATALGLSVILTLAAVDAITRYCDRRLRLLGPHVSQAA